MTIDTIKYQGKDYATVPARLKAFREENPRAAIETTHALEVDGSITFVAKITLDRSDDSSAVGTGSARYTAEEMKKAKAFEKLETIAVGRALAIMGYLNNGEVATSEEMREFEEYKENKVLEAVEAVSTATTREELMNIQAGLSADDQLQLNPHIRDRIKELQHATAV